MLKRILYVILIILLLGATGCSFLKKTSLKNQQPVPKFQVACDKRNDPVSGLTPEIQEELIKTYVSDHKTGASREKFVKVASSLPVEGGTEFVVRTKDGFSMFFMDNVSGKVFFTCGFSTPDVSQSPMSTSISSVKSGSNLKVFTGFFNLADAKKVFITWSDGTSSVYGLTNGILMISPFDNKITIKKYEVIDDSGKILYSGE